MNMLDALILVRGTCRVSPSMRTRSGASALKVVDAKIQSLLRKKAWRDGGGATPIHMGMERGDFAYVIPDDPVTAALRKLVAADGAFAPGITAPAMVQFSEAMGEAKAVLAQLDDELGTLGGKAT